MGRELKKSIPTIREREGNEKKTIPIIREREGNEKKSIPEIREREGNEKIHSHNSGKGIRGFHSWEWTGTGIPAHPCHNLMPQLTFAPIFVKSLNCGPQLSFTFLIHLLSICVTIQMIAKAL